MGDRAHPRRQGDLRELEERDETFPESPAYSAIQNDEPKVSQLKRSVLSLSASGVTERKRRDFRGAIVPPATNAGIERARRVRLDQSFRSSSFSTSSLTIGSFNS